MGALEEKSVAKGINHVKTDTISVPPQIMKKYKRLIVCADVMYVKKIDFFILHRTGYKYQNREMAANKKVKALLDYIKSVVRTHKH